MEYSLVLKKQEILSFEIVWINLQDITLNERSQTHVESKKVLLKE